MSCHKLELLITRLTDATDRNKPSHGASVELVTNSHGLPSGLVRRAQKSQRNTPSCRRSCESVRSSVLISPEFDARWPMPVNPAVAQRVTPRSEGKIKSDLIRSMQARKLENHDSSRRSPDFLKFMKCTVDQALQILNASSGKFGNIISQFMCDHRRSLYIPYSMFMCLLARSL